jgi:hypothetical protein
VATNETTKLCVPHPHSGEAVKAYVVVRLPTCIGIQTIGQMTPGSPFSASNARTSARQTRAYLVGAAFLTSRSWSSAAPFTLSPRGVLLTRAVHHHVSAFRRRTLVCGRGTLRLWLGLPCGV